MTKKADNYFSIIPHWVLFSNVSAQAIRLYCVLRKYADNETLDAYPSRQTLANKMQVDSTKTVDRAIKELLDIGALTVSRRLKDNGEFDSNLYTLMSLPSDTGVSTYPQESPTNYNHITKTKLTRTNKDISPFFEQDFEEFWQAYPRKVGKAQAKRAFAKALEKTSLQQILSGICNLIYDDIKFCPHPTTWLNSERWNDEPAPRAMNKAEKRNLANLDLLNRAIERETGRVAIGSN